MKAKVDSRQEKPTIEGLILTKLKQIAHPKGDILHVLKKNENTFSEFGEAYFSFVEKNKIKAWKRHFRMTLNLSVPIGEVKIVLYDKRIGSKTFNNFFEIHLSRNNYYRLTIPPNIWFGFKGLKNKNIILNISNILHDPQEQENILHESCDINYNWN
tara:strand:+ start:565 stop:1035 length:471 start_codon:yes stop_codon:yes gene_type:complete